VARKIHKTPAKYSPELCNTICEGLAEGKGMPEVCKALDLTVRTVWNWLIKYPEFLEHYKLARDVQAEIWAAEVISIADDSKEDVKVVTRPNGTTYRQIDYENINRSRLRVDSRKWAASHAAPKKYGDRQQVEVSGGIDLASAIADGKKRAEGTE
jgi:hypothetical protein